MLDIFQKMLFLKLTANTLNCCNHVNIMLQSLGKKAGISVSCKGKQAKLLVWAIQLFLLLSPAPHTPLRNYSFPKILGCNQLGT